MSPVTRRVQASGIGALWVLGLLCTPLARAQSEISGPDRSVLVRALVVHAREQAGPVDWACERLRRRLEPMKFGTCRVVERRQFKLRFGQLGKLSLPQGQEVRLLPISILNRELHMQVEMPGRVNTRLRMTSGRGVILGGVQHDDGYLIVHIQPVFRSLKGAAPRLAERRRRQLLHEASAPAGSGKGAWR